MRDSLFKDHWLLKANTTSQQVLTSLTYPLLSATSYNFQCSHIKQLVVNISGKGNAKSWSQLSLPVSSTPFFFTQPKFRRPVAPLPMKVPQVIQRHPAQFWILHLLYKATLLRHLDRNFSRLLWSSFGQVLSSSSLNHFLSAPAMLPLSRHHSSPDSHYHSDGFC